MPENQVFGQAGGDSRPDSDGIPVYHICADHIDVV